MLKKIKWIYIIGGVILLIIIFGIWKWYNYSYEDYDMQPSLGMAVRGGIAMQKANGSMMDMAVAPEMDLEENITMHAAADEAGEFNSGSEVEEDRLIIKTGQLSMVVENVANSIQKISNYAIEKGGFVVSSFIDETDVAPYGQITIRIPVEVFDQGFVDVKAMGEVESEQVNGRDITEEYVDLEAQLGNLQATEKQFLEIMKKAYKIEDILAVQRELSRVRGQIESIQGRMKYLKQSADLSTLTVHLSTDPDVLPAVDEKDKWKPFGVMKQAFRSLLEFGKGLVNFLIWVVVYIPLWALIVLVIWFVRRMWRRRKV